MDFYPPRDRDSFLLASKTGEAIQQTRLSWPGFGVHKNLDALL